MGCFRFPVSVNNGKNKNVKKFTAFSDYLVQKNYY